MKIYLTIPEFIVALFRLDPSRCRLTNAGRIANLHGFAYQVQSLLFEQIKVTHVSYRAGTAKLGAESYRSWHSKVSSATARFELDTLVNALAQIMIEHPNQLAAALGKDEAWSWRWPLTVFLSSIGIFNTLIAFNSPISGKTYWQVMMTWPAIGGMLFFGLLNLFLFTIPLRQILFDSSFLHRHFKTSFDMRVIRAEIFKRIKELSKDTLQRGILPDIVKLIGEANEETSGLTVSQLLNNLKNTELALKTTTSQNQQLSTKLSETEDLANNLSLEKQKLQKEVHDCQHKLHSEERSHDETKAKLSLANTTIEKLQQQIDSNAKENARLNSELSEKNKTLSETKNLADNLSLENQALQKEVHDCQHKLHSEERSHDETKAKLSLANTTIEKLQQQIDSNAKENARLNSELSEKNKTLSETKNLADNLSLENQALQKEARNCQNRLHAEEQGHYETKAKLSLANTTIEKLQQQIESNAKEISCLTNKLTEYDQNYSESEFMKQSKVLAGVLAYIAAAASITQAELVRVFQHVHDQRLKGPDRFNTKLQSASVEKVFANANTRTKNSGMKPEWFSDPGVQDAATTTKKVISKKTRAQN